MPIFFFFVSKYKNTLYSYGLLVEYMEEKIVLENNPNNSLILLFLFFLQTYHKWQYHLTWKNIQWNICETKVCENIINAKMPQFLCHILRPTD